MDKLLKNIAFWTLILLAVVFFYKFLQSPSAPEDLMDSVRFADALRDGHISRVTLPPDALIEGETAARGPDARPERFLIARPEYRDLVDDLLRQHVEVRFRSPRDSSLLTTILGWVPMLVLLGAWLYFMRTLQAAARRNAERSDTGGRSR